jgi:hypothetical protein
MLIQVARIKHADCGRLEARCPIDSGESFLSVIAMSQEVKEFAMPAVTMAFFALL